MRIGSTPLRYVLLRGLVWAVGCCGSMVSVCGFGASDYVSRPVGLVRIVLASNSSTLVSVPLSPLDGTIQGLFSNQLVGASNHVGADCLLQWDAMGQQYVLSFRADGTGDTNKDGCWFSTNWVGCTQTLSVGEGFFIENRHDQQAVFLLGAVPLAETQTVDLVEGLNLFGYPYAASRRLNDTYLNESGAFGATNSAGADQVRDQDAAVSWLLDSVGDPRDGQWLDEAGSSTSLEFEPGVGYWYDRISTNALSWFEPRPYDDPFDVSTNAPQIIAMAVGTNQQSVKLVFICPGVTGETMEVFFRDPALSNLVSGTGWAVADEGVPVDGLTPVGWMDAGSATRPAITGVVARVYLLGRQDIDSDSDGLSDAREQFVHGTSPANADTDADLINDGYEIQRGTNPTNALSATVTLYADSEIGDNGYDGLAPSVCGEHGPKHTIQSAVQASFSGDDICIASGVYEDSSLSPEAKSITLKPANGVVVR